MGDVKEGKSSNVEGGMMTEISLGETSAALATIG